MAWSKRAIVEAAFEELALAGFEYDLSPEEAQSALKRHNLIMAGWAAKGIQLGQSVVESEGGGDLDDDSGLPTYAVEAAISALSLRICASKGKTPSPMMLHSAKQAREAMLMGRAQLIGQVEQERRGGTPLGDTNRGFNSAFTPNYSIDRDTSQLSTSPGGYLDV